MKENMLQTFCFQELQDSTGMEKARSALEIIAYKGRPFSVIMGIMLYPPEILSVCPSVRPSAVDHSCPLHNFDTVRDNLTKLSINTKHDQTTCRD